MTQYITKLHLTGRWRLCPRSWLCLPGGTMLAAAETELAKGALERRAWALPALRRRHQELPEC